MSPFGYETSYFIFIGAIKHDVAGLYGVFTFFTFLTRHFMMAFLLFYFLQLSSSLPKSQNILVKTFDIEAWLGSNDEHTDYIYSYTIQYCNIREFFLNLPTECKGGCIHTEIMDVH